MHCLIPFTPFNPRHSLSIKLRVLSQSVQVQLLNDVDSVLRISVNENSCDMINDRFALYRADCLPVFNNPFREFDTFCRRTSFRYTCTLISRGDIRIEIVFYG